MLPSIAEQFSTQKLEKFRATIAASARVLVALALPVAIILTVALPPFLAFASQLGSADFSMLTWVTRAFLLGLMGHCLLELSTRIFYAQQNAVTPMVASGLNLAVFALTGLLLSRQLFASGVALADSIAFTSQALILFLIFYRKGQIQDSNGLINSSLRKTLSTILRALAGGVTGSGSYYLVTKLALPFPDLIAASAGAILGFFAAMIWVIPELRTFTRMQEN